MNHAEMDMGGGAKNCKMEVSDVNSSKKSQSL